VLLEKRFMDSQAASASTAKNGWASRELLFGGLLSSLGASLGWLIWLSFEKEGLSVLKAPAIGALFGCCFEWLREYVVVAARESAPEKGASAHGSVERTPRLPLWRIVTASVGFALLFWGLVVFDHFIGEHLHEAWLPLLKSIATMFPAGVALSWVLKNAPLAEPAHNVFEFVFGKLLRVICIAVCPMAANAAMQLAMDLDPVLNGRFLAFLTPMAGWWLLVGLGCELVPGRWADNRSKAVFGVFLGGFLLLAFSSPTLMRWFTTPPAPPETFPRMFQVVWESLGDVAEAALSGPDLPALYWKEAENAEQQTTRRRGMSAAPDETPFEEKVRRRWQTIRGELGLGRSSWLIRSELVMLFFGLGISVAPWVEARLRPKNYPTSETCKADRRLWKFMGGLLAITVVIAWVTRYFSGS
jgi:hypothetical protein